MDRGACQFTVIGSQRIGHDWACTHKNTSVYVYSLSLHFKKIYEPYKKLLFSEFSFNWRIAALQCCDGLCCTSMWMSHTDIYTSPPSRASPLQPTLQFLTEHPAGPPVLSSIFLMVIYFTHDIECVCVCVCVSVCVCVCISGRTENSKERKKSRIVQPEGWEIVMLRGWDL